MAEKGHTRFVGGRRQLLILGWQRTCPRAQTLRTCVCVLSRECRRPSGGQWCWAILCRPRGWPGVREQLQCEWVHGWWSLKEAMIRSISWDIERYRQRLDMFWSNWHECLAWHYSETTWVNTQAGDTKHGAVGERRKVARTTHLVIVSPHNLNISCNGSEVVKGLFVANVSCRDDLLNLSRNLQQEDTNGDCGGQLRFRCSGNCFCKEWIVFLCLLKGSKIPFFCPCVRCRAALVGVLSFSLQATSWTWAAGREPCWECEGRLLREPATERTK